MAAAEMSLGARRAFLTEGTRTAVLATTREDSRPHAVPIEDRLHALDRLHRADRRVRARERRRPVELLLGVDDHDQPGSRGRNPAGSVPRGRRDGKRQFSDPDHNPFWNEQVFGKRGMEHPEYGAESQYVEQSQ